MKEDPKGVKAGEPPGIPGEVALLLEKIEREPVPERLLALARELQAALVAKRRREERTSESRSEAAERAVE